MKNFKWLLAACLAACITIGFAYAGKATRPLNKQWFVFSGSSETNPAHYTLISNYDPEQDGCEGSNTMCAVLADVSGNQPVLNTSGGQVILGSSVQEIRRQP